MTFGSIVWQVTRAVVVCAGVLYILFATTVFVNGGLYVIGDFNVLVVVPLTLAEAVWLAGLLVTGFLLLVSPRFVARSRTIACLLLAAFVCLAVPPLCNEAVQKKGLLLLLPIVVTWSLGQWQPRGDSRQPVPDR